jgi:hypothetical protein
LTVDRDYSLSDLLGDSDRFGSPVGDDAMGAAIGDDAFGAPMMLSRIATGLEQGATRKSLSQADCFNVAKTLRLLAQRASISNARNGGFGGPARFATGMGLPMGLGRVTILASATGTLTVTNGRNVSVNIKRLVLKVCSGDGGIVTATGACLVTAITAGEFPVLSGGGVPVEVFSTDAQSPVSINVELAVGSVFTVTLTAGAFPGTVQISGAVECAQVAVRPMPGFLLGG